MDEKTTTNLPVQQQTGKAAIYGQEVMSEAAGDLDSALAAMKSIQDANDLNIGADEIQVARLSIAQSNSPEVAQKVTGWESGMLFDSMLREPISVKGKSPWLLAKGIDPAEVRVQNYTPFLPIFKLPTEYVKWPTKSERGEGIKMPHWKKTDISDPEVRAGLWKPKGIWTGTGSPPVTETTNILGMCLNDNGEPLSSLMIVSFSRTSFKTGGRLVSALAAHKLNRMPWWGRIYYLFTNSKQYQTEQGQSTIYVIDFAKGEKLLEFCAAKHADGEGLFTQCFTTAKQLADPIDGKELQLRYLRIAEIAEDEGGEAGSEGDDSAATVDPEFSTGG